MACRGPVAALLLIGGAALADEARIAVPPALADRVEASERWGIDYATEPADAGVVVAATQALRPLPAGLHYPLPRPSACGDPAALDLPGDLRLPPELSVMASGTTSAFELLADVVGFVTRRVVLDESDRGPQDAMAVLARGRARCSGRANLAVGLLRAAGIPARVVQGVLLRDDGARWHRWGEAWLGVGWVPFDPGASAGVVSVRYLPLRSGAEGTSLAAVRLLAVDDRGYSMLPRRGALRVGPSGGATLRCLTSPPGQPFRAELVASDGAVWRRAGRGEVRFEGMLPDRYRLRWEPRAAGAGDLVLALRGRVDVRLELAAGGAEAVRDATGGSGRPIERPVGAAVEEGP
jgi:transglutaminase-like putative cysteine protease